MMNADLLAEHINERDKLLKANLAHGLSDDSSDFIATPDEKLVEVRTTFFPIDFLVFVGC